MWKEEKWEQKNKKKKKEESNVSTCTMRTKEDENEKEKEKAVIEQNGPKHDKPWENLGSGSFSFCYWGRIVHVSVLQEKDLKEERRR